MTKHKAPKSFQHGALQLAEPTAASKRPSTTRRFLRNRWAIVGLALVGSVLFFTFALPLFVHLEPTEVDLGRRLMPPSWEHPMGTDAVGRDILARVVYGGRTSLTVGIGGVLAAMVIGTCVGMISGYFGGWIDATIMRVIDLMMAFPSMLLAIIVTAILGVGLPVIIIAICVFQVPSFARVVRGLVLSIKQREFVSAARAIGTSDGRILFRHILPNLTGYVVVQTSLNCAWGILAVAALSFLGFGAQPPTPELGSMVNEGRVYLREAPYYSAFPGLIITLTVLGINSIGDGLRDALDVRSM